MCLRIRKLHLQWKRKRKISPHIILKKPTEFDFMMKAINMKVRKKRDLRWRYVRSAAYILLFIYMPISIKTFRFFLCRQIDGTPFLVADLKQQCQTREWWMAAIVAITVLALFVIAFPLYIFVRLCRARKSCT